MCDTSNKVWPATYKRAPPFNAQDNGDGSHHKTGIIIISRRRVLIVVKRPSAGLRRVAFASLSPPPPLPTRHVPTRGHVYLKLINLVLIIRRSANIYSARNCVSGRATMISGQFTRWATSNLPRERQLPWTNKGVIIGLL